MRTRRPTTALLTTACVAALAACSGAGTTAEPEPSEPVAVEVDEAVQEAAESMIEAGAVGVLVEVRDGDDVASLALGEADLESGRAAEIDDPYRIASITKVVTAVVVLRLVEEGQLSLDDTVEEHLPGLLGERGSEVTVRQLLEHSSGVPEYIGVLAPDPEAAIDLQDATFETIELVDVAREQEWEGEPGSGFFYANTNYAIAGMLAEEVSGRPMPELMTEHVLEPAGMDATVVPTDAAMPADPLHGYLTVDGERVDLTEYEPSLWSWGASLVSTVPDVGTLVQALNAGELLAPESLEAMRDVGPDAYGLGLLVSSDACGNPMELVYGQRGNGFGYNTASFASPDGERVVTIAWTGGGFSLADDPIFEPSLSTIEAGLASTCG